MKDLCDFLVIVAGYHQWRRMNSHRYFREGQPTDIEAYADDMRHRVDLFGEATTDEIVEYLINRLIPERLAYPDDYDDRRDHLTDLQFAMRLWGAKQIGHTEDLIFLLAAPRLVGGAWDPALEQAAEDCRKWLIKQGHKAQKRYHKIIQKRLT